MKVRQSQGSAEGVEEPRLHDSAHAYHRLPVDIKTFIESDEFLASGETIYPAVMDVLREINSGQYVEAVLTGAIGTGKTTIALLTTAYQLHVLSCLRDPHDFFKLDPASEIVFAIQSISAKIARDVAYTRLRAMVDNAPFLPEPLPLQPQNQDRDSVSAEYCRPSALERANGGQLPSRSAGGV